MKIYYVFIKTFAYIGHSLYELYTVVIVLSHRDQ